MALLSIDLVTDDEIVEGYLSDASNIKGFCDGVYRPKDTKELSIILKHCNENNVSVTVTAQRTATTGAPVPHGGVLVSMENFNRIHSATEVDANVILGEYQQELARQGLMFPPDPTSRNECSVGGAIACNASGASSFKYGAMRPWVEALEVVFPTGEVRTVDRSTPIPSDWPAIDYLIPAVKTAAGYEPTTNLLDLMIGQEGTLGVITKAWLRVVPLPEVLGLMVFFSSFEQCLQAVEGLKKGAVRYRKGVVKPGKGAISPRAIEFFDRNAINFMREKIIDIPDCSCGLMIELESETEEFSNLESCLVLLEDCGALMDDAILADSDAGRNRLYQARHAIPAGVNERVIANGMPKVGTDFAVPDERLQWMMDAYAEVDLPYVMFGHIGDNHLHLNMLPRTAEELVYAKEMYDELARIAVAYGGTVSAEHGIGKIKKHLLSEMVGETVLMQFRTLKNQIDPNWILGKGTLFDKV